MTAAPAVGQGPEVRREAGQCVSARANAVSAAQAVGVAVSSPWEWSFVSRTWIRGRLSATSMQESLSAPLYVLLCQFGVAVGALCVALLVLLLPE